MPFKENGIVISEPKVVDSSQQFVREGNVIAVGPGDHEHSRIAYKNGINKSDDAGRMIVKNDTITFLMGSHGYGIEGLATSPARQETVRVAQSLTSKRIDSI